MTAKGSARHASANLVPTLKPLLGAGYVVYIDFIEENNVKIIEAVIFVDANEGVTSEGPLATPPSQNMSFHRSVPPSPAAGAAHIEYHRLNHDWESGTDYTVDVYFQYKKSATQTA